MITSLFSFVDMYMIYTTIMIEWGLFDDDLHLRIPSRITSTLFALYTYSKCMYSLRVCCVMGSVSQNGST